MTQAQPPADGPWPPHPPAAPNAPRQSRPSLPPTPPQPWGPWATLGLLLASLLIAILATVLTGILWGMTMAIAGRRLDPESAGVMLGGSAVFLVALLLAVIGFSAIRRLPLREYFALRRASARELGLALGATTALLVAELLVNLVLDRDVAQFMLDLIAEPAALPGVLVLVLVVAPVAEELIFRGFVWKGLVHTAAGPIGAAVVASLLWTLLHLGQYGPIDMGLIFLLGLLLGWARHRSGSVFVPMAMHLLVNLVATIGLLAFYA